MATRTSPELPKGRLARLFAPRRGGGLDNAGDGGGTKRVARKLPLFVAQIAALKFRHLGYG
eukprot:14732023-Alexandrium_andersonii.AAC.1